MPPHIKQRLKGRLFNLFWEWHDGLPCLTKEGEPGRGIAVDLCVLACISLLFPNILASDKIFFHFNDFANKRFTKPQLSLVNKASLERILRAKVYVNEADGQLRAAHLIIGYTPISWVHTHFSRISSP